MTGALNVDIEVSRGDFRVHAMFEVDPGTTVALLGPNGAGKSTIVGTVAGTIPIERGRITLGDRVFEDVGGRVRLPPEQRRVGLMFQDHLLFPHLTVVDNVAFPARSAGARRGPAHAEAMDWLARLRLSELAGRRPHQLSGGQAQRVALARTLVARPDVLLFDEPLAALDIATRSETRRLIAEHLDTFEGPRVLITHDPTEAFALADSVIIIEAGAIVQTGSPDTIRRHPRSTYAADLAGINFVTGLATDGIVTTESGCEIVTADRHVDGRVLLTIHPRAIAIHPSKPVGSPRNVWEATVVEVSEFGERVRVATEGSLPLTAEITPDSVTRLGLDRGATIWVAVKATEVMVEQA
jgi:molybdate transport system ATP-binding protein